MVRMDLLLNPGSPPPSPSPSDCAESPTEPQESSFLRVEDISRRVEPPPIATIKHSSLMTKAVLPTPTNQRLLDSSNTPYSPSNAPAVKRHKAELPALRLLLDGGSGDNQRDDAPHEIFSGNAFWGKVPSLNPPAASPSDVSDLGTSSVHPRSSAYKPHSSLRGPSIVQDHGKAFLLPSLPLIAAVAAVAKTTPVNVTASRAEEESFSLDAEAAMATSTTPSGRNGKKKKVSICKEDGCSSQALSKNLCMKHGGGPRCSVPDCNNGAKLKNLCFQHGGSTICLAPSCSSKAKRFGYCWSHGGGRICAEDDCNKVAAQGGMCWAHGGGNRCKLPGCTKRSYKQNGYYCKRHAEVSADY